MLDLMYDLPSLSNVKECIIDRDVVAKKKAPIILTQKMTA